MKILALNGGGMRGYVTAVLLAKAENHFGKHLRDTVGLITGVSTGSIIGAALAAGIPAQRIVSLYRELHPVVFGKRRNFFRWMFQSRFPSSGLESVLKEHLNMKMGDLDYHYMVPAYRISDGKQDGGSMRGYTHARFWKSWQEDSSSILLWKAVMASCAAPSMFDPVEINGEHYIDGGVAANNPSTCALAEAIELGSSLNECSMMHIGSTPLAAMEKPMSFRGLLRTMTTTPGLMIDATDEVISYQCKRLIGSRYLTINSNPYGYPDVTFDSNDFERMATYASVLFNEHEERIMKFLES